MVHHHHVNRKQDSGEPHHLIPFLNSDHFFPKPKKPKTLLPLFLIFSSSFIFASFMLYPSIYSLTSIEDLHPSKTQLPCSSLPNNSVCCDRSAFRSDTCFMKGHIQTDPQTNSLFLYSNNSSNFQEEQKIRPYTRKWEKNTMDTIDELRLRITNTTRRCDVHHNVPAVIFSTGGFTGNVYHEFNDGIIPLYITSHHFNRKVMFVLLEYHDWWISKYENIVSKLSDHPPIDFSGDKRTHCFKEAVIGLKIHDELSIDQAKMNHNRTMQDFRKLLDESYKPRIEQIVQEEKEMNYTTRVKIVKPILTILSRNGSRRIENEVELVKLAEEVGFVVEVVRPTRTTELAKIYRALNSSDMMIGVHGAAMTHFLFLRAGSVFLQIVPLGTDWAAEAYYGEPAVKMGLKYVRYEILPRESSLYREYEKDDIVLRDTERVNAKGWEVTKKVYLDGQNVRLDLRRFRKRLVKAYTYLEEKRKREVNT